MRSRLLVFGIVLLLAFPVFSQPIRATPTNASTAIYAPNPNHLWNRLFTAFYEREVAIPNPSHPNSVWLGPDVLDPPLGPHPKFMLDDKQFPKCNAVLDEFIAQQGANLISDPLKRVMLQRDMWAVFDILSVPLERASWWKSPSSASHYGLFEQRRVSMARKVAQIIRSLALSPDEIQQLPDTYDLAVKSGAFSHQLDQTNYSFLPGDLFAPGSHWFEISPPSPLHTRQVRDRSLFRTFIKPSDSEAEQFSHYIAPDALPQRVQQSLVGLGQPPNAAAAFQVLLLRELICLDTNLQMVPTHIVESIQFRATLPSDRRFRAIRELELSRSLLFAGKQGGLRPVPHGELHAASFVLLGGLTLSNPRSGTVMGYLDKFPMTCINCHTGILTSPPHTLSTPARSASIEALALEKETNGTLASLRNLSSVQH